MQFRALKRAVKEQNLPTIRSLIAGGSKINICGLDKDTLLGVASRQDKQIAARELLKLKADINAPSAFGQTALMNAVENSHEGMVDLLLASKASVEFDKAERNTALSMAVKGDHIPIIRKLLAFKADPQKGNNDEMYPIHFAKSCETIDLLLHHKASIDQQSRSIEPLVSQSLNQNRDIMLHCIRRGASLNNPNENSCDRSPFERFLNLQTEEPELLYKIFITLCAREISCDKDMRVIKEHLIREREYRNEDALSIRLLSQFDTLKEKLNKICLKKHMSRFVYLAWCINPVNLRPVLSLIFSFLVGKDFKKNPISTIDKKTLLAIGTEICKELATERHISYKQTNSAKRMRLR